METRNIKLSIVTAREWYNGDNTALKELALQAYSRSELQSHVLEAIHFITDNSKSTLYIQSRNPKLLVKLQKVAFVCDIANYLNEGWAKLEGNTGYYIYQDIRSGKLNGGGSKDKYRIGKHDSVRYPLIYFKNKQDAEDIVKYFEEEYLESITNLI